MLHTTAYQPESCLTFQYQNEAMTKTDRGGALILNLPLLRNKVSLKFLEGIEKVAKVVLFELPGFIGVAHSGHPKDCPPICTAICKGIAYVVKTFSWKEELAEPQESFLCTMEHAQQLPPHMCRINKRRKTITCQMANC